MYILYNYTIITIEKAQIKLKQLLQQIDTKYHDRAFLSSHITQYKRISHFPQFYGFDGTDQLSQSDTLKPNVVK